MDTEIRLLSDADDMREAVDVLEQVWGASAILPHAVLVAIAHSGGYVSAAYDRSPGGSGRILGASVGILARHLDRPALHSHITGLLPGARQSGIGREIKLHQRAWAAEHGIEWIVWTFDPLVRANGWFNLAVLGAEVHEYLPCFYGTMSDAINAGDESDRLLVAWPVLSEPDVGAYEPGDEPVELVATPVDIVALRRTDPGAVQSWRHGVRDALAGALAEGRHVLGFTRDGEYALEPRTERR